MPCLRAQRESFTADMGDNKKSSSLQPPLPLHTKGEIPPLIERSGPLALKVYLKKEGEGLEVLFFSLPPFPSRR